MSKGRMEAFGDGVIAVIITIYGVGNEVPARNRSGGLTAACSCFPQLYPELRLRCNIYWNNHHHFLHAAQHVPGVAGPRPMYRKNAGSIVNA